MLGLGCPQHSSPNASVDPESRTETLLYENNNMSLSFPRSPSPVFSPSDYFTKLYA